MSEEDRQILTEAFKLYDTYRSRELKGEDFKRLSGDIAALAERHDYKNNPLALHAALMIFDTFNDLYKGGKVPQIPDYFGRNDM